MKTIVAVILAFAALLQPGLQSASQTASPTKDLNAIIDGVDKTFASMKDFKASFIQVSKNSVNQSLQDEGLLYLTRDKKMRVEYGKPGKPFEQLWVSNGKSLSTYVPANRQVNQEKVTDAMAEQMPLMFLIGRSGLRNEFKEVAQLSAVKPLIQGDHVLSLTPKRKNQDVESIQIEVSPRTSLIDRMTITFTDKSSTDFAFFGIEINTNVPASTFEFTPPPGIRVVQGAGIQ